MAKNIAIAARQIKKKKKESIERDTGKSVRRGSSRASGVLSSSSLFPQFPSIVTESPGSARGPVRTGNRLYKNQECKRNHDELHALCGADTQPHGHWLTLHTTNYHVNRTPQNKRSNLSSNITNELIFLSSPVVVIIINFLLFFFTN